MMKLKREHLGNYIETDLKGRNENWESIEEEFDKKADKEDLESKVSKEEGKTLTDNNFSDDYKEKLDRAPYDISQELSEIDDKIAALGENGIAEDSETGKKYKWTVAVDGGVPSIVLEEI